MLFDARCATLLCLCALLPACSEESPSNDWWGHAKSDAGGDAGGNEASADVVTSDGAPDTSVDALSDAPAADVVEAAPPDAAPPPAPALYPSDRTHSPISQWVVDRLSEILAHNPGSSRDVFMKVGDSISASNSFLHCFAGTNVDLGTNGALQPTLDLYRGATVQGSTPFDRYSLCVESGRTAYWAMTSSPTPLSQELNAANASVGVVMFGTNDIGWFGDDHLHTLDWYHGYMFDLVDAMIAGGVIPILSTIPPRDDNGSHNAWVPTFNAVIRAMAQGRQIPLIDFHRELVPLPDHGLSSDGVHPNVSGSGACSLSADGLTKGYNVRNWITLTALDRVRRAVLAQEGPLDNGAPTLAGAGTVASPYLITGSPFVDVRNTTQSTSKSLGVYDGCGSAADETGPEVVYRLEVNSPVRIRGVVLDRGNVDIDIHLLDATATTAGCLARNDALLEADLAPGVYHVVLDTYVDNGTALGGEYVFALLTCAPGDSACQ